jgi:hypothetical protein
LVETAVEDFWRDFRLPGEVVAQIRADLAELIADSARWPRLSWPWRDGGWRSSRRSGLAWPAA